MTVPTNVQYGMFVHTAQIEKNPKGHTTPQQEDMRQE
jgi:hypothetical protein